MSATAKPTGAPVEILIVEDSPTQAQYLQHILEQQSYHVTSATNGRQALKIAQDHKPTLIISDVVMPEMDGYELCRRIKSDTLLGDVPVILVTTLSDPQDVIRGLECRADNFILKPYDENHLLSRVKFVLVNREMHKAEQSGMGVEIFFNGHKHFITADRLQILNLLLSTYEAAIQRNKELTVAKDELYKLNARLETANKELESFSHSVSHDLRAPLRAINGFSAILLDQFSPQMPAEAQRLLNIVIASVKNMGQLIDALLNLSRCGRHALSKQSVNLAQLVQLSIDDLGEERKGRQVDLCVGPLPNCIADPTLLRQVIVNLLSNAFKYTRHKERAVIEVGYRLQDRENVYFIRDNGAGFDMQYADNLFGVFQRFHSVEEFEGTGIGLSIVHRIIQRHGGRIWAEAEVDKGATFYFTLPG